MTEPVDSTSNVSQADYMRVFMQELAYQDPLKPIDNREFMAQMAQFSALQQASEMRTDVAELLQATYDNRGISLLGKNVKVANVNGYGSVEAISLNANKIVEMRVKTEDGNEVKIGLDKIIEISRT